MNLYAYVGNDPINSIDPSGKIKISLGVEAQLVVIAGAKVGVGAYVDTKTLEAGVTISGGPRLGLEAGASLSLGVSESNSTPAQTRTTSTATVDASASAAIGYSKEIVAENGGINDALSGNSVSGSVDVGKLGLNAGASVGVNFTGTASTDALKTADTALNNAQGAMDATAAKAAEGVNRMCQTTTGC